MKKLKVAYYAVLTVVIVVSMMITSYIFLNQWYVSGHFYRVVPLAFIWFAGLGVIGICIAIAAGRVALNRLK